MSNQLSIQTQLSTFTFETHSIRTLAINGEPWFVAKDVCDAIGIDNNRKALLALDEDEKGVTLSNTLGGQQEMNIISESGMYTLILRCREAVKKGSVPHRFRKWVTAEVLPAIRKTGKYEPAQEQAQLPLGLRTEKYSRELTEEQWLRLASLWFALYNNIELFDQLYRPLEQLGSHLGVKAYTHATEYKITLGVMKRLLEPLLAEFEVDPKQDGHFYKALKTLRDYQPQGVGKIAVY